MTRAELLASIDRHLRFLTPDEYAALAQSAAEQRAEAYVLGYIKRVKAKVKQHAPRQEHSL